MIQLSCLIVIMSPSQAATPPRTGIFQPSAPKPPAVTFEKQLRPLIVSQCVGCHNRTTLANVTLSGGLALDSYESTVKGVILDGKAIRTVLSKGKPDDSELIKRLETADTSKRMPKGGDPLPKDKIALFKTWIATGMPRGIPAKNFADPTTPPAAPPGPVLNVNFPTTLTPPAGMAPTTAPNDAKLA